MNEQTSTPADELKTQRAMELADRLDDLAHGAYEEAMSFGLTLDLFKRYFKTIATLTTPSVAAADQRDAALRLAKEALAAAESHIWNDWIRIDGEWGPCGHDFETEVAQGGVPTITQVRAAIAAIDAALSMAQAADQRGTVPNG